MTSSDEERLVEETSFDICWWQINPRVRVDGGKEPAGLSTKNIYYASAYGNCHTLIQRARQSSFGSYDIDINKEEEVRLHYTKRSTGHNKQ